MSTDLWRHGKTHVSLQNHVFYRVFLHMALLGALGEGIAGVGALPCVSTAYHDSGVMTLVTALRDRALRS